MRTPTIGPTRRQAEILRFIRENETAKTVNLKLLADHFGIHYSTALGIVSRLEEKGLVRRTGYRVVE